MAEAMSAAVPQSPGEQAARGAQQAAEQAARAAEQAARQAADAARQAAREGVRAQEQQVIVVPPTPPDVPMPPTFPEIRVETGPPPYIRDRPSDDTIALVSVAFFVMIAFVAVGVPLIRALARKWDRQAASGGPSPDVTRRLDRIEQAVEAIAVEVERIGEGQRFTNRAIAELRALPSGDAAAAERALLERAASPRVPVR